MSSAETALITENKENGADSDQKENCVFEKDTKYSWFVCACAFLTQVFVLGVLHAFGVFFVEFVKEFGTSKGSTAWVGSLAYGLSMTFSPVTSQLLVRYSYSRVMMIGGGFCVLSLLVSSFMTSLTVLFFTFSIFYGIGTCMATAPTMTITHEYFDRYMSIATGITVSGSSFGTLIMSPLSQFIIDLAGWRVAFRVFSGFIVFTIILNSRIRTPPSMTKRKMEGHIFIKDLQIWKNRVFVVWTIAITSVMFGFYIPYVHLVSYAIDRGIEPDMASLLMMVLGSATAVGRIMFGKIVQLGVLYRLHMHQMSMVITGTGVMILPLIKSYAGIVIYVIIVGLVDGCFVVLLPVMTASLMGIEKMVLAWGFLIGTCSITFTLGPPVAGALYDATGTYNVAFHCAGIPIVSGAVILFLIPWAQRTAKSTNAMGLVSQEITIQVSKQDGIAQSPESEFRISAEEDHLAQTVSIGSMTNASVQTVGSSSLQFEDKSTSTEDVSLHLISPHVADRLSQLSVSSQMFENMLRWSMSVENQSSVAPEEVQKTTPPSQQARRPYLTDDQHSTGSSLLSYPDKLWSPSDLGGNLDSGSSEFLPSCPPSPKNGPYGQNDIPGSTHSALASQLQKRTPSKHAVYASIIDLGSVHSAPSMSHTDISPSSSKQTHVSWPRATPVLQDRTAHSASNYVVADMSGLAEKRCPSPTNRSNGHNETPGSTHSALASQLQKQTPSKYAVYASIIDLGSVHSAPSMSHTDVSPSSSKQTHVSWPRATPILQDRTAHSASNYVVADTGGLAGKRCPSPMNLTYGHNETPGSAHSALASQLDSGSSEFLPSCPPSPKNGPYGQNDIPGSTHSALASQLQKQTPSKQAVYASIIDLGSVHSAPSMSHTDVSPSSSKQTHVSWPRATPVLQDRTAHSASNYVVADMFSLAEKRRPSKQASTFDETISNHVNMLRGTLTSPMSSSSRIQDSSATKQNPDTSSVHSNVSDSNDTKSTGSANLVPESSNPYPNEEPMLSLSDLLLEAMCTTDPAVSESNLQSGSTEFARENELTVVPANNPFATKKYTMNPNLEDIFKSNEVELAEERDSSSSSYELVDTMSDEEASGNLAVQKSRSTTSELDVFTHLFDDDVNNGDKQNLTDDDVNSGDQQN